MTRRAARATALVTLLLLGVLSAPGPAAQAAPSPHSVSGWGFVFSNASLNASSPDVAVAPDGRVTAVWARWETATTPGNTSLWAADFDDDAGWGAPVRVDGGTAYAPTSPRLAVDAAGNLTVVWSAAVTSGAGVFAAHHPSGGNWSAPVQVGLGGSPSVAADPGGNVTAGWRLFGGANQDAWAARYTPGAGWAAPVLVETNDSGNVDAPFMAASADGSAFAVWSQFISGRSVVWVNRYTPGGGWGNQTLLPVNTTTSSSLPQVAADATGGAHAVWLQNDGTRNNVWTARFTPGGGWGPPALLEALDASHASTPQVAAAPDGRAVAVWTYYNGSQTSALSARFDPATGWGAPVYIEHSDMGPVSVPTLRVDDRGQAFAAWLQSNGTVTDVWVARGHPEAGWAAPERAEALPQTGPGQLRAALGPQGRAAAVWSHPSGGRTAIVAYVDDAGPLLTVWEPPDGTTVAAPTVLVRGQTDPGVTLHAAGLVVAVEADGSFAFRVALAPGANVITLHAWDAEGLDSTLTRTVTFADPLPGMNASLAVAQTRIQGAVDQLALLTTRVGSVEAQAAALAAGSSDQAMRLQALEAELVNLSGALDSVRGDLAAANDNLSSLSADALALELRASTSESDMAVLRARINATAENIAAAESSLGALTERLGDQEAAVATLRTDLDRTRSQANNTAVDEAVSKALQDQDRRNAEATAARVDGLALTVNLMAVALLAVGALAVAQAVVAARRPKGPTDWPKGPRAPPEG